MRMSDVYHMRPDLVSQMMYDTDEYAEFVLKFAGISNPFSLDDDDVLLIPNDMQAIGMMADNQSGSEDAEGTVSSGTMAQIRNFFKFVNHEYQPDRTSYDRLKNTNIPSGVIAPPENNQTPVYIGEDGKTAVTIRGGRVYFGEDSGMNIASQAENGSQIGENGQGVSRSVQNILNNALTQLSDTNCLYNGMTLADWFRGNVVNKQ